MDGGIRRYAKWAGDVVAAAVMVVFEAVALFAVMLGLFWFTRGATWVTPACLGGLAVCAGIIAAASWSTRMWVMATVQGLVTGGCVVMLLIGLTGGFR
ncbi:hypothetical protein ACFWPQ_27895 [Streptomyces sp. NPDC058464]|uniref:hypothetical protein n=1 Tax=Streptomyces sp. NPDC058464 TaxID=3346511 RepID=UPI0036576F60